MRLWNFGKFDGYFRKTNFAKLNTEALFKAVNFDKTGEITEGEWLAFWEIVKKSGHTE